MDLLLSEEQLIFKDYCRRFAEEKLIPISEKYGETDDIPKEMVKEMADAGFFRLFLPAEMGGKDVWVTPICLAREQIAGIYCPADVTLAMQGLGKPGVNFGNLQQGAPHDYTFWFPGYAEGGISGDLTFTGGALVTYPRMPHVMSMNPVKQAIPRLELPDAILHGEAEGYLTDPTSMTGQFFNFKYPAPGHSKIKILY